MNRTRSRPVALRGPMLALVVLLCAALVAAGCAQNRSASTQSWSGLAIAGDSLFVGTRDGKLIQLSTDAGLASYAPYSVPEAIDGQGFPALYGTPAIDGDRVVVGAYNGVVVSLNADGLSAPLPFEIDGNSLTKGIAGSVAAADGVLVVAASEDADQGRLYVLDRTSLTENCRYPARNEDPVGQLWTTPVVQEGIAYFGDLAKRVHAIDTSDCRPVWDRPAELGGAVVAPPVIARGKLYVGAFDQAFYAIDLATGDARKTFEADNWFWAGAATDGDRVYAPNIDGNVYAYDIASDRVAWAYPGEITEPILSTPVVVGGQVVYASDTGVMTVLRASDGARQWDRRVGSDKVRAPITTDGKRVYLHSLDETVSAVDLETKQLAWDRNLKDVR